MKKLLACVFAVAMLAGCGSSKTESKTCTVKQGTMSMNATFEAKEDKITNADMKVSLDASSLGSSYDPSKITDDQKKALQTQMESQLGFKEGSGIEAGFEFNEKAIDITIKVDFEKADKEALSQFGFNTDEDLSLAKTVKNAEDNGATCK